MRFAPKRYLHNIWIAFLDQPINVLTGGAPDETISSRMGRAIVEKKKGFGGWLARTLCKGLNVLDKDHCVKTYQAEQAQIHRPEALNDEPGD